MKKILALIAIVITITACKERNEKTLPRPKLVIGLVVDQMRWDYLYRYYDRYGKDGFKRLMNNGYNCQHTMINYLPANTGPGHACIYTGSVPSIHGIAANDWTDRSTGRHWYCVEDTNVRQVNSTDGLPSMSPRNLLVTTVTDELRLATNLKSRVYGIAIKDRGSILPAGHLANAAYWYNDKTGDFTTSTYYPNGNPAWLQAFNKRKVGDSLVKKNWTLLYDAGTYTQSSTDANGYEKPFKGEKAPMFPHVLDTLSDTDRYAVIKSMPAGNTLTFDIARECINGEKLGQTDATDFLCVSLSSTDYAGHQFGPNAIEMEDMYLRLDMEITAFLQYLDNTVGKDNYVMFLSADHGAAHNTSYLYDMDIPGGMLNGGIYDDMNAYLKGKFGTDSLVKAMMNYQVYFADDRIAAAKLDRTAIKSSLIEWLNKRQEITYVVDMDNMGRYAIPEPINTMVINGYNRKRSGSIQIVLDAGWIENSKATGTTHGTWQPYDTHIPLLWYGWHIKKGQTDKTTHMEDIAPTIAALLHIQMPNGCIGKVIDGVIRTSHSEKKE
ncbi:MAG: alkaline phosphatase family protein [Taibaiella sp.]|nr:alkaline phosphatase family protein [Taibaiella sp.]